MTLTKTQKETLHSMKGEEILSIEFAGCIGIEYPYIIQDGDRTKLNGSQWLDLYNEYWNSSENEGYWLKQEAQREFL